MHNVRKKMTDTKNDTPMESAEELEAETKDLAEVKEDEVRDSIIEEFGFDAEDDKERIDKMVTKELGHRTKLSKTIGQKVKYRDSVKATKKDDDTTSKKDDTSKENKDVDLDEDKKFNQRMDKRDLAEMEYPDEIKKVIGDVAKINEISVKKALSDPYVEAKIKAYNKKEGIDDSALSRKDNKKGSTKSDDDTDDELIPPDVDLNTEEGRKEYDKWKEDMIKAGH